MRQIFLLIFFYFMEIFPIFAVRTRSSPPTGSIVYKKIRKTTSMQERLSHVISQHLADHTTVATNETIFGPIFRKQIPCHMLYEDDQCVAFDEAIYQAPKHFMVVPRRQIRALTEATESDKKLLGHSLIVGSKVAREIKGLWNGYRTSINVHRYGGQTIYHYHTHVLGGREMDWPPG